MSRSRKPGARRALAAAAGALALSSTHCGEDEYPLNASFCDDWCRVLLRAECDTEPENCVRECEQSLSSECFGHHVTLLDCYETAPPSAFECSDDGFDETARPEDSVCRSERDALIGCAYPDVQFCIDACRRVEATQAVAPPGAEEAERLCPSRDVPCDSICWLALTGPELDVPGSDEDGDDAAGGSDPDLAIAGEIVACALERASACRAGMLGTNHGATEAEPLNWSSVLGECATMLEITTRRARL